MNGHPTKCFAGRKGADNSSVPLDNVCLLGIFPVTRKVLVSSSSCMEFCPSGGHGRDEFHRVGEIRVFCPQVDQQHNLSNPGLVQTVIVRGAHAHGSLRTNGPG